MIDSNCGIFRVGLFEIDVDIDYNNDESRELVEFLFQDLPRSGSPVSDRRFEVLVVGKPAKMSLWLGEKQLYFGESKQALAHILVNEIIYDCITNNSNDHAVHAAAFCVGERGVIMPGKSGSGKSSLAAWLTAQGYTYLTDELVLLSKMGRIRPFTRPLSLKPPACDVLTHLLSLKADEILTGQIGTMVPHRSLNRQWTSVNPSLGLLIYPEFIKDQRATLTKISSARSCLKLMESYVNARNIPEHGFSEIAALTRTVTSYELKFGSFDDLPPILYPVLSAGL
jgi:hypothetical protein